MTRIMINLSTSGREIRCFVVKTILNAFSFTLRLSTQNNIVYGHNTTICSCDEEFCHLQRQLEIITETVLCWFNCAMVQSMVEKYR